MEANIWMEICVFHSEMKRDDGGPADAYHSSFSNLNWIQFRSNRWFKSHQEDQMFDYNQKFCIMYFCLCTFEEFHQTSNSSWSLKKFNLFFCFVSSNHSKEKESDEYFFLANKICKADRNLKQSAQSV